MFKYNLTVASDLTRDQLLMSDLKVLACQLQYSVENPLLKSSPHFAHTHLLPFLSPDELLVRALLEVSAMTNGHH